MTGNWCFKDGVISFEEIFSLYQQHFNGRLLTIVSDCCYAGQWVHRCADKLDSLNIGACGHKARAAGLILKIFTACQPDETAFDTVYAKKCVWTEPARDSLMVFNQKAVEIKQCSRFQTPSAIDTTRVVCFSSEDEHKCKYDQFPHWVWKDLAYLERRKRLHLRLFRIWDNKDGQPYWRFMICYDDKFEEFCGVCKAGHLPNCDLYGHTVFSGYGRTPPPEIEDLFFHHGPTPVNLTNDKPTHPGSEVHLKVKEKGKEPPNLQPPTLQVL